MTIETRSRFVYGIDVCKKNSNIYFDEGFGESIAVLSFGTYTIKTFAENVESTLNNFGTLKYCVSYDKCARTIDISADGAFSILIGGASAGDNFASLAGLSTLSKYGDAGNYGDGETYGEGDLTGLTIYRSKNKIGCEYLPQFPLQSYIDERDERALRAPARNESASGVTETIFFGKNKFYTFDIKYATNRVKIKNNYIDANPKGVEDLEKFMDYIIERKEIEFFPDRDDFNKSSIIVLEKTNYRLREVRGATGYFQTGALKFRKLES